MEKRYPDELKRLPDLMEQIYSDLYKKGYRFTTNCVIKDVKKYTKKYSNEGFDVEVGERAFDMSRKEHPSMRAIFIKKRD